MTDVVLYWLMLLFLITISLWGKRVNYYIPLYVNLANTNTVQRMSYDSIHTAYAYNINKGIHLASPLRSGLREILAKNDTCVVLNVYSPYICQLTGDSQFPPQNTYLPQGLVFFHTLKAPQALICQLFGSPCLLYLNLDRCTAIWIWIVYLPHIPSCHIHIHL